MEFLSLSSCLSHLSVGMAPYLRCVLWQFKPVLTAHPYFSQGDGVSCPDCRHEVWLLLDFLAAQLCSLGEVPLLCRWCHGVAYAVTQSREMLSNPNFSQAAWGNLLPHCSEIKAVKERTFNTERGNLLEYHTWCKATSYRKEEVTGVCSSLSSRAFLPFLHLKPTHLSSLACHE